MLAWPFKWGFFLSCFPPSKNLFPRFKNGNVFKKLFLKIYICEYTLFYFCTYINLWNFVASNHVCVFIVLCNLCCSGSVSWLLPREVLCTAQCKVSIPLLLAKVRWNWSGIYLEVWTYITWAGLPRPNHGVQVGNPMICTLPTKTSRVEPLTRLWL